MESNKELEVKYRQNTLTFYPVMEVEFDHHLFPLKRFFLLLLLLFSLFPNENEPSSNILIMCEQLQLVLM